MNTNCTFNINKNSATHHRFGVAENDRSIGIGIKRVLVAILVSLPMLCLGQGEGGVFTQSRFALLKSGDGGGLGNNPSALNWFNDLRNKTAVLGSERKLGLDDIEGSVYLNDQFIMGSVFYGDELYGIYKLRYDAFNDEVELIRNAGGVTEALHKSEPISCEILNEVLVYRPFKTQKGEIQRGYLFKLIKEGRFQLYQRKTKIFKEGKQATTSLQNSFPHRFVDKMGWYLSVDGVDPKFFRPSKKAVFAFLSKSEAKSLAAYVNSNNLSFKDPDHLVVICNYLNGLK